MKQIILSIAISASALLCAAQGAYVEFRISSYEGTSGSMKTYYQDGNTRIESNMLMPHMSGMSAGMNYLTISLKSKPHTIYQLNETAKTYTETVLNPAGAADRDKQEFDVTIIGKEKVNGYNATHVKVQVHGGKMEEELWLSTDVTNYARYQSISNNYTSNNMYKALSAKGAEGFPVRILAGEHGHNVQMDLMKSEARNNPSSLFSLDGYTRTEKTAVGWSQNGNDFGRKMQSTTPEQRQKMIDSLKTRYGKR